MSSSKDPMCEVEAICPPSSRSVSVPYIGIVQQSGQYITPIHTTEFGKESVWLCSDLVVHYPNRFKEFSVKYTLGGTYAGLFNVDENGVISRSSDSTVQGFNQFLYTFVKGTLDDGREYYNFTTTPLLWTITDGVSYEAVGKQVVGPEVTRGSTIVDLSSGLRIDDTFIKSWGAKFTSSSKQPYEVKVNGRVVLRRRPAALSVLFTVKVNAVSRNGEKFTWTEDHTVTFATTKCSPDGIWPETGACYQATHACTTFGSVFDGYGVVRRQCNQNGTWEKPDFSGCRLKKKQDVILVTFAFPFVSDLQYTADMLYDLRNYHLEGVPVESVDFSCDFSTDWASGRDTTITFVVVLSEPLGTEPSNVLKYLTGRIGGRRYNQISYQGFMGRDNCPRKTPCNKWGYNLVCALSDSEKCQCRSSAVLVPSPCCAANGKGWNC